MNKSDSPTYVTRAELDALIRVVGVALASAQLAHARAGYADGTVDAQLALAERAPDLGAHERAALEAIIKAFSGAIDQHYATERRRAHDRGNAYHRLPG